MVNRFYFLLVVIWLFPLTLCFADNSQQQAFRLSQQQQDIDVDGKLNEAAWKEATVISLEYAIEPGQTTIAPVKTTAYLFENGQHLNIAIHAFDPNPKAIRASLRARDDIWNDDNVGIIIDTFNNQRAGFGFFVNPVGAQADFTVDDSTEFSKDYSWDAIWHSAGRVTEDGFVVEMQIPLNSLRYQQLTDLQTWNIGIIRQYPRENWTELANYPKDHNLKCTLCQYPSMTGLKGTQSGGNLQLTPTLTLGKSQYKDVSTNQWVDAETTHDIGMDVKWGITQDVVVNATINPDFSQVEADAAQLDVNKAFALFYPEKRPFFLDGADYFNTTKFEFVHTRNIADPDYGAKVTGKSNRHSYGLIVANDNRTDFLLPEKQRTSVAETSLRSDIVIGRYNLDFAERNTIGGLITNRNADGYKNQLVSVDGIYWLGDANNISYQVARSESTNPKDIQQAFNLKQSQSGNAYAVAFHRQTNDYELSAEYERIDEDFRADLGFIEQANIETYSIGAVRNWYAESEQDWFKQYELKGEWDSTYDLTGELVEQEAEMFFTGIGEKQFFGQIGLIARKQQYFGETFNERQLSTYVEFTPVAPLYVWVDVLFGKQIDYDNGRLGNGFNSAMGLVWQANQHLQIDLKHSYSTMDIDNQDVYTAHLFDATMSWQFDMRNQLRLIVQYTD